MTDEETTQLIERLLTRIEGLERIIESLGDLHDFEPTADSPAAKETQTIEDPNPGWGVDPVEGTRLFASVFMTSAHAGLEPLRRVLKPPSLAWAPYVLARSTLESSARAWWICDPDIEARERIERAWTEQLYGFLEYEKAYRALDNEEARQQVRSRWETLCDAAEADGFTVINRNDAPIGIGSARKTHTELARKLLAPEFKGEIVYRHYAAMSHSVIGALGEGLAVIDEDGTRVRATPSITNLDIVQLVSAVTVGICKAFDRRVKYFGWIEDEWASSRDSMMQELQGTRERFRSRIESDA